MYMYIYTYIYVYTPVHIARRSNDAEGHYVVRRARDFVVTVKGVCVLLFISNTRHDTRAKTTYTHPRHICVHRRAQCCSYCR